MNLSPQKANLELAIESLTGSTKQLGLWESPSDLELLRASQRKVRYLLDTQDTNQGFLLEHGIRYSLLRRANLFVSFLYHCG